MIIGAAGGAIAAAGISAAATVGTSLMSGDSGAAGAASAQAANDKLTREQLQLAGQARDRANAYQSPYYNQGSQGQNKLAYLLGTSNIEETPNDTSYNAYRAIITQRNQDAKTELQQHMASRPNPKNKKAFAAWKKTKDSIIQKRDNTQDILKKGTTAIQFQKWQEKQPGTIKREIPKDASYGSLLADFGEKWQDPEFKFEEDPGYQFRKEQGNRELDKRLSAMGLASSGAALKEGSRFNQGLADQSYNDAFNRFQTERGFDYGRYQDRFNQFNAEKLNKFNMLTSQAQSGQQAAGQMSQNENIYGGNVTGAKAQQNQDTQQNIYNRTYADQGQIAGVGNAIGGLVKTGVDAYGKYQGAKSVSTPKSLKKSKLLGRGY